MCSPNAWFAQLIRLAQKARRKVKEFFEIKWMHKIPKILNKHLLKMGVDADTSVARR